MQGISAVRWTTLGEWRALLLCLFKKTEEMENSSNYYLACHVWKQKIALLAMFRKKERGDGEVCYLDNMMDSWKYGAATPILTSFGPIQHYFPRDFFFIPTLKRLHISPHPHQIHSYLSSTLILII